ncbi:hypothetical protein Tco_1094048 [Tanacetum coccineum]|uniref:Uncharacterized protein n=1 Tax=Tanacetum coccineum TaxID=301880 RepID=A0ABQ5IEZ2_9ASTR
MDFRSFMLEGVDEGEVASGVPRKALPPKVQKVSARASKVAGEAYTPLDVDGDSNIHGFDKNPLISDMQLDQSFVVSGWSFIVSIAAFEEVDAMKEPYVLEKMSGYRPSSKEENDQAGDALENALYPFLAEYVVNPYASLSQLLSKKPPSL